MYNDELIESSKIKWQSFLKGDDDAYAWLYSRYVQQLYQYGCRFTTDTEMVKDCVQDVFVNVYRQKDRYSSPPDNVKIYLMSSLRNSIFNVFNKVLIYISTLENHRKAGVGKSSNQIIFFGYIIEITIWRCLWQKMCQLGIKSDREATLSD